MTNISPHLRKALNTALTNGGTLVLNFHKVYRNPSVARGSLMALRQGYMKKRGPAHQTVVTLTPEGTALAKTLQ